MSRLRAALGSLATGAVCLALFAAALGTVTTISLRLGDVEPPLEAVTTNDTTTTTTWVETVATLPAGFDPHKLTTTTTEARKAVTTARPAAVDVDTAALEQIIRDGFATFGAAVAEQAVNVAHCEAPHPTIEGGLDPNATGDEGEIGLFQIHPKYQTERAAKFGWSMADLYDPVKNVTVAADLYAERGWQPWSCRSAA